MTNVELHTESRIPEDVTGKQKSKAIDELSRLGRTILVNPKEFLLEESDVIFIIADEKPEFAEQIA